MHIQIYKIHTKKDKTKKKSKEIREIQNLYFL